MTFKNVSVVCEGQTEVDFIKKLNKKYFNAKLISLKPIAINKTNAMNGNVSMDRLIHFIKRAPEVIITTFIDYYGFKGEREEGYLELEERIRELSGKEHIIAYVQLHETEALWFTNINAIKEVKNANASQIQALEDIVRIYSNPEDINNSRETAPSKRLETIFSDYKKIRDGNAIADKISIEEMKEKCPHFSNWLDMIEEKVNVLR
ncbi:putative uncharacterized protein [Proteobacteria bacterium CAG:495]|jgi:hypothetical protein|nr:putative uncharacterized protein [Proteobacteria bacterium CAG:495]